MTSRFDNSTGDLVVLVRPSGGGAPSYEKVGRTLGNTLRGFAYCLDDATSSHLLSKCHDKNVIFVGPSTEPSFRRILPFRLFARRLVVYCTLEGPPLLYWVKPIAKLLSQSGILQIVTPSKFVREHLEKIGISVSTVIPHAIDLNETKRLSADAQKIETVWSQKISEAKRSGKTVLLCISSFSYFRKGLYYYMKALDALREYQDEFLAVLKVSEVTERILSRLINHVLPVEGILSELELCKLYSLSDVVVFPSLSEGFGLPIIESFSFGKPVITLNAQPMSEINSEETGYLIKTKSEFVAKKIEGDWTSLVRYRIPDMEDFVEKLLQSIVNQKERKLKGINALSRAKNYDCNTLYRKFLELF